MKINVSVKPDFEELAKKFKGFETVLIKYLREGVLGYGYLVERGSKMFSPVDTGRMRASINTTMGVREKGLAAYIQPDVDYAIYVHEGTRYMAGRPFMKWGLGAYEREGEQLVLGKINQAVKELENVSK